MLPPFHIRNLWPSSLPKASQDTLVRINAPCYDETILSHPAATLKYYDQDDGDLITLGSSRELTEKLEEPVLLPLSRRPADSQSGLKSSEHHVFEIDDRACVQRLWQRLQSSGKDLDGISTPQAQGDALEWSAEQKDMLAVLYERRKAEMWCPIAEELGLSWQSVDAMHWVLGKEEIALRAQERDPRSERSGSFERTIETKPESTYNPADTQHFEDYRVHHFNATRPPQVRLLMPVSPQPLKMTGLATTAKVSNLNLDHSASSFMGKNDEASPAEECKTQAQAVGSNLRSRMTAVDSHQSRWPNLTSSPSAPASNSPFIAFDGPGLTSEGKRQAQVAGDKLRWRTNPIRHLRPSRVGTLEHAISKNRWSSYSGTRAARFDEHQDPEDKPEDASKITDNEEKRNDCPKSLLEVFEAELARKVSATDGEEATENQSPVQNSVPEPAIQGNISGESQAQRSPQGPRALLGLINEHLPELTARKLALSQDLSTVVGHGIRGLGACMQSVARGLQEVSSVSRHAADRTRDGDIQLVDDVVLSFQSLAGDFIAALGGLSVPRDETNRVETDSSSTKSNMSDNENPKEDAITSLKSNQHPANAGEDSSNTVYGRGSMHANAPRYISEKAGNHQPEQESKPWSEPAMSEEPRSHKPGLIQLPNRTGYVDHLRQSQSVEILHEQHNNQGENSPPLDSYFPTLSQFEEEIGAAPTFPALPNMQPLVPQRAPRQHKFATKAEESGPTNGGLPFVSFSNVIEGHGHSALQDGYEVEPLSRLSSAARLAEPFDPLEAEPSARVHLTEGVRRNATVASTDIRRATRRRRPYSESFDGSGRVPWGSFLQDNVGELGGLCRPSGYRERPSNANQQRPKKLSRPEQGSRCSPPAAPGYDDQHHDDSTVGKINDCVERLRDLGFGGQDGDSGRLLVYAQAADGVLVDAIDLIDEEQRAWQRL